MRRHLHALIRILTTKRDHRQLCRSNAALARQNVELRLAAAQAELDAAEAGYVFLAGDSHAELLGHPELAGRPVVNGGIGGRSARHYAEDLQRLAFPRRAGMAVLIVGTNDIMCRSNPLSERAIALFEASVRTLLAHLCAHADRVIVSAIPPVGSSSDFPRDPRAVALYSWQILLTASQQGCAYFDPFASVRANAFGQAQPDALRDDVHLVDYESVRAAMRECLRSRPAETA